MPGFYDDVTESPQRFRDDLATLPFSEDDWLQRSGTRSIGGEAGYAVLERLWVRPAIEVTSVIGGIRSGRRALRCPRSRRPT